MMKRAARIGLRTRLSTISAMTGLLAALWAGPATAQQLLDRLTPATTNEHSATPIQQDDANAISRSLDSAREDSRQAAAHPSPNGATKDEVLERDSLLSHLVETLGRHRALFERLADARREATEMQARAHDWNGLSTTPPYSILFVDQLRNNINLAVAQTGSLTVRRALFSQFITDAKARYHAAEILARQSEERESGALTDTERDRQRWMRTLAQLRTRVAAEDVAEALLQIALADAEALESRATQELLTKQLDAAKKEVSFSEADRDRAIAAIDRQRKELDVRARQLAQTGDSLRRALEKAQQALTAATDGADTGITAENRAARLNELEQNVEIARLLVENHDLAVEMTARMQELRNWERIAWQYRWLLFNSKGGEKYHDAVHQLNQVMTGLEEWGRYADGQIALTAGRISEYERRIADAGANKDGLAQRFLAAYRERAETQREAQQAGVDLRAMLTVWRHDINADNPGPSARGILDTTVQLGRAAWDFELFSASDTLKVDGRDVVAMRSVTVGKSVGVVLLLVLGYFFSAWLMRYLSRTAVRRLGVTYGHARTATMWAHVILQSVIFIFALYLVNIPLTVFAFLGGALAIGVGFGTQVLLKNMISGLMLLLERPLRVGDRIEVGTVVGTVTNISIRSSTVHTSEGIEILVPNSTFVENNVTNWTYSDAQVRRSVKVGVDYGAAPEQVSELLLGVAASHPGVLKQPAPRVLLENFGDNALEFDLQYWIDYRRGADGSLIGSELRIAILQALTQAGIAIPYPQRVVHLPGKTESP